MSRNEHSGRERGRGRRARPLVLAVLGVSLYLPAAPGQAHAALLQVRLPGTVSHSSADPGKAQPVHGNVELTLPRGWLARRPTNSGTTGHVNVRLSSHCTASIEISPWVGVPGAPISEEIAQDMAFWFYTHKPPVPPPVPLVAHGGSAHRAWALGTPPVETLTAGEPASPKLSPYFGVLAQSLATPHVWGAVSLGVRTPPACTTKLPRRTWLQSGLERMLRSARFHARIG